MHGHTTSYDLIQLSYNWPIKCHNSNGNGWVISCWRTISLLVVTTHANDYWIIKLIVSVVGWHVSIDTSKHMISSFRLLYTINMDDLLVLLILQYLQLLTCLVSAIGYWSTHACVISLIVSLIVPYRTVPYRIKTFTLNDDLCWGRVCFEMHIMLFIWILFAVMIGYIYSKKSNIPPPPHVPRL